MHHPTHPRTHVTFPPLHRARNLPGISGACLTAALLLGGCGDDSASSGSGTETGTGTGGTATTSTSTTGTSTGTTGTTATSSTTDTTTTDTTTTDTTTGPGTTTGMTSTDTGTGGCPVGSEGCPCGPGDMCDLDLQCDNGMCVPQGQTCGNGIVEGTEECDDMNPDETDDCLSTCVAASCGDGFVWAGNETCDDGNMTNGDGCNNDCEPSGSIMTEATVDLDGGKDIAYGVTMDAAGNVIAVGRLSSGGALSAWIRKYDPDLNPIWTRTFKTMDGNAWARGVATAGNTVYATGRLTVAGEGGNMWLRRYDSDGNLVWEQTYNGAGNSTEEGRAVAVDTSGFVIVAGDTWEAGQSSNGMVRKYDPNGNVQWTRTINGSDNGADYLHGIVTFGTNMVVVGELRTTGESSNIFVRRYGPDGNTIWWKQVNGDDSTDSARSAAIDGDGNLVVVGTQWITGEAQNVWVGKYDLADGTLLGSVTYAGAAGSDDVARGVAATSDGYVLAGGEWQMGTSTDILVQRRASDDSIMWTQHFDGGDMLVDRAYGVVVDGNDNIYAVGQKASAASDLDIWIAKIRP